MPVVPPLRLSLKREALAALTSAELGAVAGGAAPTTPVAACVAPYLPNTLQDRDCISGHTCIDCLTRWC